MKKLLCLFLLLPAFSTVAFESKKSAEVQIKDKATQAKIYRNHDRNWRQPDYARGVKLFKCYDSWGHKLRGKFLKEQKYFIELGGGSCYKFQRKPVRYGALDDIIYYDFPVDSVYQAIREIKRDYGLRNAQVVQSENIHAGLKTFKYTLVFKTPRKGYREFRVKHSRWSGRIKNIYEV